ncbi:MAG: DCC1-like thiol-disulfide oxidoreductase family protein, partial [Opitutales bacterium]
MKPSNKAIVFFDGDCGLCSVSIRFLIKRDSRQHLYFAPLQGVTAQAILPQQYRESLRTMVYQRVSADGQTTLLVRSEAVLLALIDTRSGWRHLAQIARLLPLSLRDWGYDRIADNRKIFFKAAACKLVSPAEHARILP